MKKFTMLISAIMISGVMIMASYAQVLETNTISNTERKYEHKSIFAEYFHLLDSLKVPSNQLFLYSYTTTEGWHPIPFQIDEKDTTFFDPPDGIFDSDDEILFMIQDLGDKVGFSVWIDNQDSRNYPRFEIEVVDSINNNVKGWCYLFRSQTLSESDKSQINYLSYDENDDKIASNYYEIDHKGKWFPEDISISTYNGGNGTDFYDRTKLRLIARPAPIIDIVMAEDSLITKEIKYIQGPIRVRRKIIMDLVIDDAKLFEDIPFTTTFYPYSTDFSGNVPLHSYYKIKTVRMSYDLNMAAKGMKFYSGDSLGNKNSNIEITGTNKINNVDTTLTENVPSWTMVTSNQGGVGTMLTMNNIFYEKDPAETETYSQNLYFWDDTTKGTTLTGSPDFDSETSDFVSYGDHGMVFNSYSLVGMITYIKKRPYLSKSYLLPANQSAQFAVKMFNNFLNTFHFFVKEQEYQSIDVAKGTKIDLPNDYKLYSNYPNPFNSATTISFKLPKNQFVSLVIYDIHGKIISQLISKELNAGNYSYIWDGKNNSGDPVSSGVYFYSLETVDFKTANKMAFIK